LYGTRRTYQTTQTTANLGDRFGKLAFWLSANYQDSHSQPLQYVTSGTLPSGTTGGYQDTNKVGSAINVLGATGLLHTQMLNAKLKAAYDLTPTVRAAYTLGYWRNDADAGVQTYIRSGAQPVFGGQSGFASGYYGVAQGHVAHSLSLRSD